MKPILLVFSPPKKMRYRSAGDWQDKGWGWLITVVKLKDWRHGVLIAVHELVEMACCKAHGVTEAAVDRFDFSFDSKGEHWDVEPGDHPKAPYRREHQFASRVERMLAKELGVDWSAYERALESLTWR